MFLRGLDAVRRKKIAVKNTAINKFLDNKVSAMADISTNMTPNRGTCQGHLL